MSRLWKEQLHFTRKGVHLADKGIKGFGGWNFLLLYFLRWGSLGANESKSTCFTFSGAGSCKWLTSKGVMRGTVWKPSSTEGGLVPFSLGLPFSFTILTPFFPDLRQAVGFWLQQEVRQKERADDRENSTVLNSSTQGAFNLRSVIDLPLDFLTWFPLSNKTSIIKTCHLPMGFNSTQI